MSPQQRVIDEGTRQSFDAARELAQRSGQSLINVLDFWGLLLTRRARRLIKVAALREAQALIRDASVPRLLGEGYHAGTHTAQDMRRGVEDLLERHIADIEAGRTS